MRYLLIALLLAGCETPATPISISTTSLKILMDADCDNNLSLSIAEVERYNVKINGVYRKFTRAEFNKYDDYSDGKFDSYPDVERLFKELAVTEYKVDACKSN